jgi:transposase
MVLADGVGTPPGVYLEKASPAEVKLLEPMVKQVRGRGGRRKCGKPQRLIGDWGYDSNPIRAVLVTRGIEPIIPTRSNNTVATHQDGRRQPRSKRRWIVERSNAWLQNFRHLVVRYERSETIFVALVPLACALITLKRVLG